LIGTCNFRAKGRRGNVYKRIIKIAKLAEENGSGRATGLILRRVSRFLYLPVSRWVAGVALGSLFQT
jgi:hypothetical protein